MFELFRAVQTLIDRGAVHIRSGKGVNETSDDLLLCLLYREVAELDTARMPHRKASELEEVGDILTVLIRLAIRRGWTLESIEAAALAKIRIRYEIPAKRPTRSGTDCCVDHLVSTGRGVLHHGQFTINANHCVDGERARCSSCKRTWVHVCDEAEGCSWQLVTPTRKLKREESARAGTGSA